MPTKRAWSLLMLAVFLYFLANQTQVGWIYLLSNSLTGLLIVAFLYSRGMLRPIGAQRWWRNLSPALTEDSPGWDKLDGPADDFTLTPLTFHEDDAIEVILQFNHRGLRPALMIGGQEDCPFAPPAAQRQPFFIPTLFKNQPVRLTYQTRCDRRGAYTFSALPLHSKGPFGLYHTKRNLAVPGEILIYPAYHPFKRLRLLERTDFAEKSAARAGAGSQVIGAREYRIGDSLRQIHWRSTARQGKLIVKEFTDDDHLTLTVVLDLATDSNAGTGKFSTFETAIRLAASFGYYATHKHIPFYLAGSGRPAGQSSRNWTPPATALSWWVILNYLAKVENNGQDPLPSVLNNLPVSTFVVVLISKPTEAVARALTVLPRKGIETLAILITPDGAPSPPFSAAQATGLTIKSVTPYNWPAVLETL